MQDDGLPEGKEGSPYWKGIQGRKEIIRCSALKNIKTNKNIGELTIGLDSIVGYYCWNF